MTEQELKRIQHKIEPYVDFTDMFIIYQAIEKQIPKKPKQHLFNDIFEIAVCECGAHMLYKWEDYCPYCGQKLDWSDEDETETRRSN